MLTRLLPEQIASFWNIVKYAVEESLPPIVGEHPDKMNRILSSLLSGKTQCWVSYTRDEKINFEGVVLTQMLYDGPSNTKNLLIYCLYGYERVANRSWLNGLRVLGKYARSQNCSKIIAYTNEGNVINLVKRLGGETEFTFISFSVNEIVQKLNGLDGD